jgi:hypothetical protein
MIRIFLAGLDDRLRKDKMLRKLLCFFDIHKSYAVSQNLNICYFCENFTDSRDVAFKSYYGVASKGYIFQKPSNV